MNRRCFVYGTGLALVLACYAASFFRVLDSGVDEIGGRKTIRIAHWQLETGIRDAIDQLARVYEAEHPGVRIEQVAIPERIYAQWLRTQLIGGTACDIIELGGGTTDELLARFFLPLSAEVAQANPYNAGGPLEGVPWRSTFVDGMSGGWSYRAGLLDYYGVPLSLFTIRVFYNQELWREVLGDTPPPRDFEAFISICARAREHAARMGRDLVPIAGSKNNGPMLIDKLMAGQTQRLVLDLNVMRNLAPTGQELGHGFLNGDWSMDSPALTDALTLVRQVQGHMQTGYDQLSREDAAFYFLQRKALMITTGSWDALGFRSQADFPIAVFDVPLPSADHPRYGKNLLGRLSEASVNTGLPFGVTRQSLHPELAVDFLRFITSRRGNEMFARVSGWLPAVEGVRPEASMQPFEPEEAGYPNGFSFTLLTFAGNMKQVYDRAMHQLSGVKGSVAGFQDAVRPFLPEAARKDLERHAKNIGGNVTRQDTMIAAERALSQIPAESASAAGRLSLLIESQNQQEAQRAWALQALADTAE